MSEITKKQDERIKNLSDSLTTESKKKVVNAIKKKKSTESTTKVNKKRKKPDDSDKSDYEKLRDKNVARNNK